MFQGLLESILYYVRAVNASFALLEFKDNSIVVYMYWIEDNEVKIEETVINKE